MKNIFKILATISLVMSATAHAETIGVLMKGVELEDGSIAVLYAPGNGCKLLGNVRKQETKKPPRIAPEVTWQLAITREVCQEEAGEPKYKNVQLSAPLEGRANTGTRFTLK